MIKKISAVCFILLSFFVVAKDHSIILDPKNITEEIYQHNLINLPAALIKSNDVTTNNGVMTLNFKNGKKWRLTDNLGIPDSYYKQNYEYLGDIAKPSLFVIKVNSDEKVNYLLVDKNTGIWTVFDEIPLLSEDKKKAVTLCVTMDSSINPGPPKLEVKLFNIQKNRFELIDSTILEWHENYDIRESYWKDNTIYVKTQHESELPEYTIIKIDPN